MVNCGGLGYNVCDQNHGLQDGKRDLMIKILTMLVKVAAVVSVISSLLCKERFVASSIKFIDEDETMTFGFEPCWLRL